MKINSMHSKKIRYYGGDILKSSNMRLQRKFRQHGDISVLEHSIAVACTCLFLVSLFRIRVNERALVRGALLHDYFLYDWHVPDRNHRLHGFTHAKRALNNALRDFQLNDIEKDMIKCHMFPLNLTPPRYRESAIICIADKICAAKETLRLS